MKETNDEDDEYVPNTVGLIRSRYFTTDNMKTSAQRNDRGLVS